jgi:hypothetical protein
MGRKSDYHINYDVGFSCELGDFVVIEQRSDNGVDTKSIQHFCLVRIPNKGRDFERVPFGMIE